MNESTAATGRGVAHVGGGGVISLLTATRLPQALNATVARPATAAIAANRVRRAPE